MKAFWLVAIITVLFLVARRPTAPTPPTHDELTARYWAQAHEFGAARKMARSLPHTFWYDGKGKVYAQPNAIRNLEKEAKLTEHLTKLDVKVFYHEQPTGTCSFTLFEKRTHSDLLGLIINEYYGHRWGIGWEAYPGEFLSEPPDENTRGTWVKTVNASWHIYETRYFSF